MPLNVSIAINGHPIKNITIGRIEDFKGKDFWHQYIVRVEGKPEDTATFSHLYRSGAEECVRRGLEALATNREKRGRE